MKPRLTSDARAALDQAGLSRRQFLQGTGRDGRRLCLVGWRRRLGGGSAGAGHQRSQQPAARLVDRHRRRRHGHRLYRQVRVRPGTLHRADAARGGRAVRADGARQAGAVRHGGDAGSGHDVGTAVAPRELQPGQPGAGGGHRARGAGPDRSRAAWRRAGCPGRRRRRSARFGGRIQAGELRGAARRAPLRPDARRGGEAPASQHVEGTGPARAPGRSARPGHRPGRVRPHDAGPGHAARARGPAAERRRHAGTRERCRGPQHAGRGQGGYQGQLRRRRRREGLAGACKPRQSSRSPGRRGPR